MQTKKRILIWVLLLTLIVSVFPLAASAAGNPAIAASSVSGCPGTTVRVEISISGNSAPGIVGAELKGTYDATKLEFLSFSNGGIMSSPLCNTKGGSIYISWDDSLTSGIVGDGVMGTLTFKILDSCSVGDIISIDFSNFYAFDTDFNDVPFQISDGTVMVRDHTWGTPAYTWSSDDKTCTAKRIQTCGCGGTETETANSTKKDETTQTVYTVSFKNPAFATQTKKVAAGPVKVTFRLIGATQSENGVDLSKGSSDSEYVTWIPTKTYTIDAGSTAYDLIKKALTDAGLDHEMTSKYLSSVDAPAVLGSYSLAEFDNGPRSGWMFTVNGKHGSLGIGEQVLKNGDTIIVHYVNDYVYEESKFPWLEAPDVAPTAPHQHSYTAVVTAPTCTKDGYTTYSCSCGNSYTGNQTAAKGHTYKSVVTAPTCTKGGSTTYTCTVCGDSYTGNQTDATGHSYGQWYETKATTAVQRGEEKRVCTKCGHFETRTTDPVQIDPTDPVDPTTRPTDPVDPTTQPTDPADPTTQPTDPADPTTQPTDPVDPTTQPTDPDNPSIPTKPTAPTDPVDPALPSEGTETSGATDPSESTGTADSTEPSGSKDPSDNGSKCACWYCRWWWLLFLCGIAVNALITWGVPTMIRKLKECRSEETDTDESEE